MNKTKYRIKEAKGYFIPQWKGWFFWHDFIGSDEYPSRASFDTLGEAREFIAGARVVNAPPKIHNVDDSRP